MLKGIGLLDSTGAEVVSYTYNSWGALEAIGGTKASTVGVANPYRYRGYRYDTESGLYYLQSRYYNPEWDRFISADALIGNIGELLSHNTFAYCMNNSINFNYKSGFQPAIMEKGIGGAPGGGGVISGEGLAQLIKGFYYAAVGTIGTIVRASGYNIYKASKSEREYNQEAEHTKKTRSEKNKHQEGQSRKKKDKGGEKGDKRRTKNSKRYVIPK